MAKTPRTIRLNDVLEANINTIILKNKQFNFNEYVNSLIEKDLTRDDFAVAKQSTVSQELNPNTLLKKITNLETMFEAFSNEILNYKDLQKDTFEIVDTIRDLVLQNNSTVVDQLNECMKMEVKTLQTMAKIFDVNNNKLTEIIEITSGSNFQ